MLLRRERPADAKAVRRVHALAFASPDPGGPPAPEAELVDGLRAGGHIVPACSIVAVEADAVVGHVVCSRASVGEPAGAESARVLGLGPLGVLPDHQRRGVGSALMHAVLGAADACDIAAVVLLGEPAYYGRFGFELARRWGITPPDPSWEPAFQLRRLTAWDDRLRGEFRYAAPFLEL
jgi:putative acetyltransferase